MHLQVAPEVLSEQWSVPQDGASPFAVRGSLGEALAAPELSALTARALAANPDVAIATARIDQARALMRVARASMLPSAELSAGIGGTVSSQALAPFDFSQSFARLDVSYDLDLFGGARAGRRAQAERVRAARFDRAAIMLGIETEVARIWLQQAALAERITLLDRNIAQALELERIIRARLDAGAATRVDLGLQTVQVRQLQTDKARLLDALDKTRTALAVLCGAEAPRFTNAPGRLDQLVVPRFDAGAPGDLLVRRPDVQAAEALIAAAGGEVAQARAAFLPRLQISAGALAQSASLGGPVESLLSLGGNLLAPIFNRGRLHGEFDLASARQREAVEVYRRTLLRALAEVEDGLSSSARAGEREQLILQMLEEARLTARLLRIQYVEGDADLRDVLNAEERLIAAEDAQALVRQERIEAAIDLFRATGGRAAAQP